jgi:hypothetical protein
MSVGRRAKTGQSQAVDVRNTFPPMPICLQGRSWNVASYILPLLAAVLIISAVKVWLHK